MYISKNSNLFKVSLVLIVVHALVISANCQIRRQCSNSIFTDLVKPLNYPIEEHVVTTKDGYKLTVFRIQAKGTKITQGKPVIILQHGNEDSSDNWVINDENKAPGFYLANQGYDIWLPNNRGNKYSMTHESISLYNRQFWDYSFQEMGARDQPAIIDYILKKTGQEKVVFVGHSQGTTQMFAGLSDDESKDYLNSKISKFIALAPVVFATQCNNKALKQYHSNPLILQTCDLWGQWQLYPAGCSMDSQQDAFMKYLCTIMPSMCKSLLNGGDMEPEYDNLAKLPLFFSHSPNGASVRCFQHFAQMFSESKTDPRLRKFDFGSYENGKRYGAPKPPAYEFANIKVPVALFSGLQDTLADTTDVTILAGHLRSRSVKISSYMYNSWGHMTFVWGLDVNSFFEDLLHEVKAVAPIV